MIGAFQAEVPSVGIFWVVETARGEAQLLTAGCSLEAAEPCGDFLNFPDGHYEMWDRWRKTNDSDLALGDVVRSFEYEDWPRGRIVFDRLKKRFTLYADAKLMNRETIAQIEYLFLLPAEQTTVERDFHYQSHETQSSPS
jgi:hypothetical protein